MPRIPRPTMTATMMRMILRALLPPLDGGGAMGAAAATAGIGGAAEMAAPHLLQNFVPSVTVAPQELQNAISHLVDDDDSARRASIPQIEVETEKVCFVERAEKQQVPPLRFPFLSGMGSFGRDDKLLEGSLAGFFNSRGGCRSRPWRVPEE